jgi:hypothetical protein
MKFPFNRIEALIFSSIFPLFFLLHWNGFLGFFYEGIAIKIGSASGFGPALVSAISIYLVVLVGYYFLKKMKHNLFANRWRAGVIIGGLVLLILFAGYYFLLRDFLGVERCLTKGESWNYELKRCEIPEEPFMKEKLLGLRMLMSDLPPIDHVELSHQAWVYTANKFFQDEVCLGNVSYGSEIGLPDIVQKAQTPDGTLVGILCNNTAYNTDFVLLLQQDQNLSVVEFDEVDSETDGLISSKTAFGLDYDPTKKIFTTFYKLRGLGDCGTQASYIWNTETKLLELQEFRSKDSCDGKNTEWPVIFPQEELIEASDQELEPVINVEEKEVVEDLEILEESKKVTEPVK